VNPKDNFLDNDIPLSFLDNRYITLGLQYFVLARMGGNLIYNPVCCNLYHLAFEMLIKAYLNLTYSKNQMWSRFRHDLPKLWKEFKIKTKQDNLERFDQIIKDLHVWEDFRYLYFPNKSGVVGIETIPGHSPNPEEDNVQVWKRKAGIYSIYLEDMDELFKYLIFAMGIDIENLKNNPTFKKGLEEYTKGNKHSIF